MSDLYKPEQEPDVHPLEDLVTVDGHAIDTETLGQRWWQSAMTASSVQHAILLKMSG